MTAHRQIAALLCCCIVGSPIPALAADGQTDVSSAIDAILARATAIFSCEMTYEIETGNSKTGQFDQRSQVEFALLGESWTTRYVGGGVNTTHNGKSVEFVPVEQPDKQIRTSAQVHRAKRFDEDFPHAPVFAGSFWRATTRQFLLENRGRARLVGTEAIDGVECKLIELDVARKEVGKAFYSIPPELEAGGKLRIFAAPALGYVLPKVEFTSTDGLVYCLFTAEHFEQHSKLSIPTRLAFTNPAKPGFFVRYQLSNIRNVNEAVVETAFSVHLPVGTQVADVRDPKLTKVFTIDNQTVLPADISDVLSFSSGRNWVRAVTIGVTAGLILIVLFILIQRRRGARFSAT